MKREVKFRFRLQLKAESFGKYRKGDIDTFYINLLDDKTGLAYFPIEKKMWDIVSCDEYTGLKDKNGKEMYDKDIVKADSGDIMLINWNNEFASFCLDKNGWAFSHFFMEAVKPEHCEVIGNFYQHPHLLK